MSHINEFNSIIKKAEDWILEVAQEMKTENHTAALQAMRATLQALRDRLPVNQAAHVSAQLPVILAGYFYEGWKPASTPTKERSLEDFLDKVQTNIDNMNHSLDSGDVVKPVLSVLARRISQGESRDIYKALPEELKQMWEEAAGE